jgi:hypothetical protein
MRQKAWKNKDRNKAPKEEKGRKKQREREKGR